MKYIPTGRPRGRPRTQAEAPTIKASVRFPRPLFQTLDAAAKAQHVTITALVLRAVEQCLDAPTDVRTAILAHVATATRALLPLEQALQRSPRCQQYLEQALDALANIELELDRVSPQPTSIVEEPQS